MPDPRFFSTGSPLSLAEIARITEATVLTTSDMEVVHVAPLNATTSDGALFFASDKEGLQAFADKNGGACLTTAKLAEGWEGAGALLVVSSPRSAFANISERLHSSLEESDPQAGEPADIAADANIHPSAVIAPEAKIGAGAKIGPHCYIGRGVVLGANATLGPGVTITHALVGDHASILAGARIGQAGFGFVPEPTGLRRVPQFGRVIIEDYVEIGANTTIDRGALEDTIIGTGTKIDNLVQIGHNVRLGAHCIVAAQTGISGSCVIEDGAMMGGQVGLADHLNIGKGAQIAAGSGLMRDVPDGEKWGGRPGRPVKDWLRETATLAKLAKQKNGKK